MPDFEINNPAGRLARILWALSKGTGSYDIARRLRDEFRLAEGDDGWREAAALISAAMSLPDKVAAAVALHQLGSETAAKEVSDEGATTLRQALLNLPQRGLAVPFSDANRGRLETWSYQLARKAPSGPSSPEDYRTLRQELQEFRDSVASDLDVDPQLRAFVVGHLEDLIQALLLGEVVGTEPVRRSLESALGAAVDPRNGGFERLGPVRQEQDRRSPTDQRVAAKTWEYLGRVDVLISLGQAGATALMAVSSMLGITAPSEPPVPPAPVVIMQQEPAEPQASGGEAKGVPAVSSATEPRPTGGERPSSDRAGEDGTCGG